MHDEQSLKAQIGACKRALQSLEHRDACKALQGHKNFDYECPKCNKIKDFVQAKADLAASVAYRESQEAENAR